MKVVLSPTETSSVFGDSIYMNSFSNNTIDPNSTNPGYKITLTNAQLIIMLQLN